jgi:hypothetical protein
MRSTFLHFCIPAFLHFYIPAAFLHFCIEIDAMHNPLHG